MPVSNPFGSLLSCLAGRLEPGRPDYLTPEQARRELMQLSGEDFGYDVRRWLECMIQKGYLREGEYRILDK